MMESPESMVTSNCEVNIVTACVDILEADDAVDFTSISVCLSKGNIEKNNLNFKTFSKPVSPTNLKTILGSVGRPSFRQRLILYLF